MKNRITAILFILVANIFLLAHSVIPHHHHHLLVCIQSEHCKNDSSSHRHDDSLPYHEHDHGNNDGACSLKQAVLLPTNQLKNDHKCELSCSDNHLHEFIFLNETLKTYSIVSAPLVVSPPDISFPFSKGIATSFGLRAPPIV